MEEAYEYAVLAFYSRIHNKLLHSHNFLILGVTENSKYLPAKPGALVHEPLKAA